MSELKISVSVGCTYFARKTEAENDFQSFEVMKINELEFVRFVFNLFVKGSSLVMVWFKSKSSVLLFLKPLVGYLIKNLSSSNRR